MHSIAGHGMSVRSAIIARVPNSHRHGRECASEAVILVLGVPKRNSKTCVRQIARSEQKEEEEEKTPVFYVLRHLQCLYKIKKLYIPFVSI